MHRDLERVLGGSWRTFAPKGVDHSLPREDPVGVQGEERQKRALTRSAEVDRRTLEDHLERSEQSELAPTRSRVPIRRFQAHGKSTV